MEVIWQNGDPAKSMLFARDVSLNGVRAAHNRVLAGTVPEHVSDFHEINITLDGDLRVEKDGLRKGLGGRYAVCGPVCVTPHGQAVEAFWEDRLEIVTLMFDPRMIARVAEENRFSSGFEIVDTQRESDPIVEHLGLELIRNAANGAPIDRLYSETIANTLAVHLLKNYSTAIERRLSKGGLTGYRLKQVTDYINDNLDQDLTLAELAAVSGLSRFHFSRAFRNSTGLTPQKYLMAKRVERAKQLLASSDIPIVEVSLMTGFKNQSHFTSLFRRFTSLTPRNWRQIG